MVKAQETKRLLANTASEPQEPLSPSQSHGSLEEDCPHPLSVNSPGRGTQAPGRHGLFSHPWRGPGCWSHLGPGGEGCCPPHIQQDGGGGGAGGMFPKGPPISGVPVPVPIRMEAQRIFGARTTQLSCPALQPGHCVTQAPSLMPRLTSRKHRRGPRTKDLLTRGTGGVWTETRRGRAGGIRASLPWGQSFRVGA